MTQIFSQRAVVPFTILMSAEAYNKHLTFLAFLDADSHRFQRNKICTYLFALHDAFRPFLGKQVLFLLEELIRKIYNHIEFLLK